MEQRRILFVPLDWGLGHATRILPLIREAVAAGDRVWIGGNGRSGAWLRSRFPELPFEEAPAWTPVHRGSLVVDFVSGIAGYWRSLKADREWAGEVAGRLQLTHLVSDHRYGLGGGKGLKKILVVHQVWPALPFWASHWLPEAWAFRIQGWLLGPLLARWMGGFDQWWIPDQALSSRALAPALSQTRGLERLRPYAGTKSALAPEVRYLGWLSRWTVHVPWSQPAPEENRVGGGMVLVVLSGPEPGRSDMENKLLEQWGFMLQNSSYNEKTSLPKEMNPGLRGVNQEVAGKGIGPEGNQEMPAELWLMRGIPEGSLALAPREGVRVWDSPDEQTLCHAILKADLVVGRPGYSSLMDYAALAGTDSSPALRLALVPARGHSEQEYLAKRLSDRGLAWTSSQHEFSLASAWQQRHQTAFTLGRESGDLWRATEMQLS